MDRDVVERARAGDREAFADLVDQVSDTLLGVVRRIVRDHACYADAPRNRRWASTVRVLHTEAASAQDRKAHPSKWSASRRGGSLRQIVSRAFFEGQAPQRVSVLIADMKDVTVDACERQVAVQPPVGPTVEDLAVALAQLPPFEVSSPAEEATLAGYSGTHLQLRVPLDQPFEDVGAFIGCDDTRLASCTAPPLSIASPNTSDELIAERQAILDSVVIER